MEENKEKKMSAFCEELVEKIENMEHKPSENDFAIVICGDGDICSLRVNGSRSKCCTAMTRIMKERKDFAEVVMVAAEGYILSRIESIVHAPEPPADGVTEVPLKPVVKDGTETN